jgi:predicted chitinase
MSIFKETFKDGVKKQLKFRQDAMLRRNPQDVQLLNSRNSWIRMSSAVDIYKLTALFPPTISSLKDKGNYDNSLARKYILQGGVLTENGTLKAGVGGFNNAYSDMTPDGVNHLLGIRPMPGITNIDVKSKGAYGSLREVTVNFQCWDIKQLEELELLYMRPGYTVLVEWGWAPYLDADGKYKPTVQFYDIINNPKSKEEIFKDLDNKMHEHGNYEAMFGYVKNYSWSARADGGYDCQTSIISLGEVIESLKVNYTPSAALSKIKEKGLLGPTISAPINLSGGASDAVAMTGRVIATITLGIGTAIYDYFTTDDQEKLEESYTKNILAGMFFELYTIGYNQVKGLLTNSSSGETKTVSCNPPGKTPFNIDFFHKTLNVHGKESSNEVGDSDEQIYISLESLVNLLNSFVVLRDKDNNKETFLELSVKEKDATEFDQKSGKGYLKALAHPLQISTDPTICLIKNNLWASGIKMSTNVTGTANPSDPNQRPVITFKSNIPNAEQFVADLIKIVLTTNKIGDRPKLLKHIKDTIQGPETSRYSEGQIKENVKEVTRIYQQNYYTNNNYKILAPTPNQIIHFSLGYDPTDSYGKNVGKTIASAFSGTNTFYDLLEDNKAGNFKTSEIDDAMGGTDNRKNLADSADIEGDEQEKLEDKKKDLDKKLKEEMDSAKKALEFMKEMPQPYFVDDNYKTELGIIGNIFINLNFLYNESVSDSMASQDKKEKNDIALYDFIKNIMQKISESIGNLNNFDIFVEPNGKTARIIDVNYVDDQEAKSAYENAVQIEIHNLKSTVRSYKFESKIFPEQSTQVAIGAQVSGGALGVDVTSLVDFNKKIRDRIIPVKDMPTSDLVEDDNAAKLDALLQSLETLYKYFGRLEPGYVFDADFDADKANDYNNALKDLINFLKSITKSKTNSKSIIPTKLSIDMDGIGGLIIGNIFKIPTELLPKGYKGDEMGTRIGYIVTGLGHTVGNSDWVTNVDAQFIILDDRGNDALETIDYENIVININPTTDTTTGETPPIIPTVPKTPPPPPVPISNNVKKNLDEIEKACRAQGLTNDYIIKAIKANVMKETGGKPRSENVAAYANTSNDRIKKIFGSRVAPYSEAELTALKKNTVEFCDVIYGLKSGKTGRGLGNTQAGDGYKFRGRGYIQITGRSLYTQCGSALGKDFVNNPDSMNTSENAAASTVWYIKGSLKIVAPRSDYKLDPNNPQPKDQLQANLLITNCIGGVGLKLTRPSKSAIFNEILAKVDKYSTSV